MASERTAVQFHDRLVEFVRNCRCCDDRENLGVDSDGACVECGSCSCEPARALLAEIEASDEGRPR